MMEPKKTRVTIVGTTYAKPGVQFVYTGKSEECESCSINRVCHNLDIGRRYEVVAIRAATHACPVHYQGAVTVDVTEAPVEIRIPEELAKKNTTILIRPPECDEACESYGECHPAGISAGQKYIIIDLLKEPVADCRVGLSPAMVRVIPLPDALPRQI
jgi:uncharacterized protein (UPF0179 family)